MLPIRAAGHALSPAAPASTGPHADPTRACAQVRSVQAEIRALRVTQTARAAIATERNRVLAQPRAPCSLIAMRAHTLTRSPCVPVCVAVCSCVRVCVCVHGCVCMC